MPDRVSGCFTGPSVLLLLLATGLHGDRAQDDASATHLFQARVLKSYYSDLARARTAHATSPGTLRKDLAAIKAKLLSNYDRVINATTVADNAGGKFWHDLRLTQSRMIDRAGLPRPDGAMPPALVRLAEFKLSPAALLNPLDAKYISETPIRPPRQRGPGSPWYANGHVKITATIVGDVLVMTEAHEAPHPGGRFEVKMHASMTPPFAPSRITVRKADGKQATGELKEGTWVHSNPFLAWPMPDHDMLTLAGFVRLVPMLPRTTGRAYTVFGWIESSSARISSKAGRVEGAPRLHLECLGPDTITIDGRAVKATRYRIDAIHLSPVQAWVDGRDRVVRFTIAGLRYTLADRQ